MPVRRDAFGLKEKLKQGNANKGYNLVMVFLYILRLMKKKW